VPKGDQGLAISFRDNQGVVHAKEWATDAELTDAKAAVTDAPWAVFFKSIASDVLKGKAKVSTAGGAWQCTFLIGKEAKTATPFTVKLDKLGNSPPLVHRMLLTPLVRMAQKKRLEPEKEARFIQLECGIHVHQQVIAGAQKAALERQPRVTILRNDAASAMRAESQLRVKMQDAQLKLQRLRGAKGKAGGKGGKGGKAEAATGPLSELDAMYEEGGARQFQHLRTAIHHVPVETPMHDAVATVATTVFPLKANEQLVVKLKAAPSNPTIQKLMKDLGGNKQMVEGTLLAFQKLDEWDFNVFDVEDATGGNALQVVTYALLHKLDLVNHFQLNPTTLRKFLAALQAGYHPNPFHNSTHAADVTQINYFIVFKAGLAEKCNISKEEQLAALLSGAIHDYDHPGFNNNFHTRTNAYLSTLYNDRSILENHHCACVYEILRREEYNIFSHLTATQQTQIRDTILEMVLATDMGNHAKFFGTFRRRVLELHDGGPDAWHGKENVQLALAIGLKMADISNSGRPLHLYTRWAKNISEEFYNQGDAEVAANLSLSPFMDRKKEAEDFPKGQVSFMKFIVIPMFEAIGEFLPKLNFTVANCTASSNYWQRRTDVV